MTAAAAVLRQAVADMVTAAGLEFLGITDLQIDQDYEHFRQWLAEGRQAEMGFLNRYGDLRRQPAELLPGATSAIIFALNYNLGDRRAGADQPPRVAQYARLRDYHKFLRRQGEAILTELLALGEAGHVGRVFVDTAPILERALAAKTAAGFVGKNTLFIHPQKGSFLLLGEILTSLPLPVDDRSDVAPERRTAAGGCGSCRRCQVHCPTGALDRDYSLDARKCLAYWTIEHRGPIPFTFWPWLRLYYFGCDLCQLACPYNRQAPVGATAASLQSLRQLDLAAIAMMNQDFYEQAFGGTPMTRAKREGLRRNALIAMTVTGHPQLAPVLAKMLADDNPTLQTTARQAQVWLERGGRFAQADLTGGFAP